MNIHFLYPEDTNLIKESYIYNTQIAEGLKSMGHNILIHNLPDDFPFPSESSLQQCRETLESIPQKELIVIDNEVLGVVPDFLKEQYSIVDLVHITLSADPNLTAYQREMVLESEKRARQFVSKFITSTLYTANLLKEAGIDKKKIATVIPGVNNSGQKEYHPEIPSKLLNIAPFLRNKGHINLLKALTALKSKDWELHCYGNTDIDPEYVNELQILIRHNGLKEKVYLHGPVSGSALSELYINADLFIQASHFEVFNIACMTALSHGVPVIAPAGGGISETVPVTMSKYFKHNDIYVLQTIIEEVLENPELYKKLYMEALTYHKQAPNWQRSTELFEKQLI
jgi:glycosyltransferase involved in cell wall biosynthesis